jgi:UDP-arabinose 4-epimerase
MSQKRILVTGGAGYIGSHACKALLQAGYVPVAYDNMVYGHQWAVKWGPLEVGDIADRAGLDEVIEKHRPVAVMHFAAYTYVGESMRDPGKYYRNNVAATLTLLEAMRDHQIDKVIFSSSCAVYGIPGKIPIPEGHPKQPISPYGHSKMMIEQILRDFGPAHGIRSVSLRYFNAAGADLDCMIGEVHVPETHLIPLVLDAAAGKRPYVTIFGTDYETPDGTCIRDFIHVTDLVDAHVLALKLLEDGKKSTVYNLGNGQGFSVREVIETAKKVTRKAFDVKIGPRRPGDPPRLVGDATRAARELGWRPRYPDLSVTVETAWKWTLRCQNSPSN